MQTRLFQLIRQVLFQFKTKWTSVRQFFIQSLCFLVFGFFSGSFFGTFLNLFRTLFPWDGLIIFILLGTSELLTRWLLKGSPSLFSRLFNCWKIGVFLGFFIDAFKVGS